MFKKRFVKNKNRKSAPLNRKQRNEVKSLIKKDVELKYLSSSIPSTAVSTVAVVNGVPFDVTQGILDQQRIGDAYTLAGSVELRYSWTISDTTNICRFILFQWRGQTYALNPIPTAVDILINGPTGVIDVYSHYNHDNRFSYTILYDRTVNLIGNGTAGTFPGTTSTQMYIHKRVSLKKAQKEVQLVAGGGQGKNRLFLCYVSDSSVVNHPTLFGETKMFFRDA